MSILATIPPKLLWLRRYAEYGWPIFPCVAGGKQPLTSHGFKDATTDVDQIEAWHEQWPDANWAMPTGAASGKLIIDIDARTGGLATWEALRNEHPDPIETVTVETGGGGQHLWFNMPAGDFHNTTGKIAPGIDTRGEGGYVLVPPSATERPYTFLIGPKDAAIDAPPAWLLERLNGKHASDKPADSPGLDSDGAILAAAAVMRLSTERVENYEEWVEVGMALHELGDAGLTLWDTWSQRSKKYRRGDCQQKWTTFDDGPLGVKDLLKWAEQDSGEPIIPPAPRKPKPSDYRRALETMGFTFRLNEMDDAVHCNGIPETDIQLARLRVALHEHGYKDFGLAEAVFKWLASERPFHPVRDYLDSLTWNGEPAIGALTLYFEDRDNVFSDYLFRWLVGCVARAYATRYAPRVRMLVLNGPQNIGKSYFARWLASPVPAHFIESPINTEDKDFRLFACRRWIWEVAELGATTRRADREALKAFISMPAVDVRKAYGKREIQKPALATFLGTLNNEAGFLHDPTGSSRFMCVTLRKIDWGYTGLDVNQMWAEAVHLYRAGEPWDLTADEARRADEVNETYEVDTPMVDYILRHFDVDPADPGFMPSVEILDKLREKSVIKDAGRATMMDIGGALRKLGVERAVRRIDGKNTKGWTGVRHRGP